MTLDPRPENYKQLPKRNWDDLNRLLQFYFKKGHHEKPSLIIHLNDYEIPKNEIIEEAESKGYKITEIDSNNLRIE